MDKFLELKKSFDKIIISAVNLEILDKITTEYLGRKGKLAFLMGDIAKMSKDEKKVAGEKANAVKAEIESKIDKIKKEILAGIEEIKLILSSLHRTANQNYMILT